jgi:hypothetical protein
MFVCCECCVLSGRGLCVGLITRPEESYRLWRVVVWSRNLENEEAKARYRAVKIRPQWVVTPGKQINNIRRRRMITFTLLPVYLQGKRPQHDWLEHRGIMGVLKKIRGKFPCQKSKHGSCRAIRSPVSWNDRTHFFNHQSKFMIHSPTPILSYIIKVFNTASLTLSVPS